VTVPGLTGDFIEVEARYDHANTPITCPNCGGLGIVWGGWFTCNFDGWSSDQCGAVALVSDGRCFVRVSAKSEEA
jgi:hypothetical protein